MESLTGIQGSMYGEGRQADAPDLRFTIAFQPIVHVPTGKVWGYEALVRGEQGESAAAILGRIDTDMLYRFDLACRERAIEMAGRLFRDTDTRLSINFLPNAIHRADASLQPSLDSARRVGLRPDQLVFEFTENERLLDTAATADILSRYKDIGLLTALDDFGAGYSGLLRLASLHPDLVKIDMALIRDIDADQRRKAIVAAIIGLAKELDITVIAEGIQTEAEFRTLEEMGVALFQGFYFGMPEIGTLPTVSLPRADLKPTIAALPRLARARRPSR
ncbi:EAL domain-containing protein [Xanthobacteraceae bacterium A53D]